MPAVGGATAVHRTAGVTLPVDARLGGAQQALHLTELGVGLLQLGGPAGERIPLLLPSIAALAVAGTGAHTSASTVQPPPVTPQAPPAATAPAAGADGFGAAQKAARQMPSPVGRG